MTAYPTQLESRDGRVILDVRRVVYWNLDLDDRELSGEQGGSVLAWLTPTRSLCMARYSVAADALAAFSDVKTMLLSGAVDGFTWREGSSQ